MVLSSVCRRLGTTARKLGVSLGVPPHRVESIAEKLRELGLVTPLYRQGEPWLLPTDSGRRFYRRYLSAAGGPSELSGSRVPVELDLRLAQKPIDPKQFLERLNTVVGDSLPPRFYGSTATHAGEARK
jgi:hypothetical protein